MSHQKNPLRRKVRGAKAESRFRGRQAELREELFEAIASCKLPEKRERRGNKKGRQIRKDLAHLGLQPHDKVALAEAGDLDFVPRELLRT